MIDIFSPFEDSSLDSLGDVGDTWPEYPWLTDEEIEAAYRAMEQGLAFDYAENQE